MFHLLFCNRVNGEMENNKYNQFANKKEEGRRVGEITIL